MKRVLTAMAIIAALFGPAHADISPPEKPYTPRPPPPEEIACARKQAGDVCQAEGAAGVCTMRMRYLFNERDQLVEINVLACLPKNSKKKSSQSERSSRAALAFALVACCAGVLTARRRHRRA